MIMNAQMLITDGVHLMGSDSVEGFWPLLIVGNDFSIQWMISLDHPD
jgi:hypothetical protein